MRLLEQITLTDLEITKSSDKSSSPTQYPYLFYETIYLEVLLHISLYLILQTIRKVDAMDKRHRSHIWILYRE